MNIKSKNIINKSTQAGSTLKLFILFLILLLSVGGGAMYFGHWLGFRLGSDSLGKTAQAYHKLKMEQADRLEEITKIKEDLLRANQERDVSLRNLEDIRNNLDILQKREKFLISQRDAFQSMISEEVESESLQIFDQSIKRLPENAFEYAFDLVLIKPKGTPARNIRVDITLLDGDAIVKVPLENDRYEIDGFKRVQGRFIMPKGFTPKKLRVVVSGAGDQNVEQYYNWRFGKKIKNMPQSLIDVPPLEDLEKIGMTNDNATADSTAETSASDNTKTKPKKSDDSN